MMSDFKKRLNIKLSEFIKENGFPPKNMYIGSDEEMDMRQWVVSSGYAVSIDFDIEGKNRPEIEGILVYVVNDTSHFEFS